MLLFTNPDDSLRAWTDAKVAAGQDAGNAKFVDGFSERVQPDSREICQRFIHWSTQSGRSGRILMRYSL